VTDTQHEPDTQTAAEVIDAETVTGEAAAVGELSWVDPRSLIVGVNIRGEANLDRHFVRDIADRGVREPIHVRRRPRGRPRTPGTERVPTAWTADDSWLARYRRPMIRPAWTPTVGANYRAVMTEGRPR
jgi:hypothetical protein